MIRKFIPQKVINIGKHLPTALVANLRYGFPSRKLKVIGVTGTDGKTTTVNMIYQILKDAGKKVSMISTVGAKIGDNHYPVGFHVTSPSPFAIQRFFNQALKEGAEYMVLEITSHALDQYRSLGVKIDIGVITNVTNEHLDYHKSFDNYLKTKLKLLKGVRVSILNRDNNFSLTAKGVNSKLVTFGLSKNADFNPQKLPLRLKLLGEYNLMNALAAAAVGVNLDIPTKIIRESLSNFAGVKGRMEEVENNLGIKIIIDFAHTPNGLWQALKALKQENSGKIISLIGAEGYRDQGKRAMMGEISVKNADITIITSVDPRGLIEEINQEMLRGAETAGGKLGETVFIENDRQRAIELGVKMAKKGDLVALFGKGHEQSMNIDGKKETDWSDFRAVEEVLKKYE